MSILMAKTRSKTKNRTHFDLETDYLIEKY